MRRGTGLAELMGGGPDVAVAQAKRETLVQGLAAQVEEARARKAAQKQEKWEEDQKDLQAMGLPLQDVATAPLPERAAAFIAKLQAKSTGSAYGRAQPGPAAMSPAMPALGGTGRIGLPAQQPPSPQEPARAAAHGPAGFTEYTDYIPGLSPVQPSPAREAAIAAAQGDGMANAISPGGQVQRPRLALHGGPRIVAPERVVRDTRTNTLKLASPASPSTVLAQATAAASKMSAADGAMLRQVLNLCTSLLAEQRVLTHELSALREQLAEERSVGAQRQRAREQPVSSTLRRGEAWRDADAERPSRAAPPAARKAPPRHGRRAEPSSIGRAPSPIQASPARASRELPRSRTPEVDLPDDPVVRARARVAAAKRARAVKNAGKPKKAIVAFGHRVAAGGPPSPAPSQASKTRTRTAGGTARGRPAAGAADRGGSTGVRPPRADSAGPRVRRDAPPVAGRRAAGPQYSGGSPSPASPIAFSQASHEAALPGTLRGDSAFVQEFPMEMLAGEQSFPAESFDVMY